MNLLGPFGNSAFLYDESVTLRSVTDVRIEMPRHKILGAAPLKFAALKFPSVWLFCVITRLLTFRYRTTPHSLHLSVREALGFDWGRHLAQRVLVGYAFHPSTAKRGHDSQDTLFGQNFEHLIMVGYLVSSFVF